MSLVIPIFVRGVEEGGGFMEFPEVGGGGVVKKRESPDFRSPEVGISDYGEIKQLFETFSSPHTSNH